MRLNFSGSTEDEIREGIKRIGGVVSEQVELYRSITGEHKVVGSSSSPHTPAGEAEDVGGDVLPLPPRKGEL